jgi:hypothetical protein
MRATIDGSREMAVYAIDLITDTWNDFSYFIEEAQLSEQEQDPLRRYRCVRAAIAALFSHLDGIISAIFDMLSNDSSFGPYKHPLRASLHARRAVRSASDKYCRETVVLPVPRANLRLIAHDRSTAIRNGRRNYSPRPRGVND